MAQAKIEVTCYPWDGYEEHRPTYPRSAAHGMDCMSVMRLSISERLNNCRGAKSGGIA